MNVRACLLVGVLGVAALGCGNASPSVEIAAPATGGASAALPITIDEGDWPWWRGPGLDGRSRDGSPPTVWDADKNIVWKTSVQGVGHSSPTLCGDRILLTTADEQEETQSLTAFDRDTGELLWAKVLHRGGLMRKHQKNSHASPTPACDGRHVYAAFINDGALRVTAADLKGEIVWQANAGEFSSEHGYGSAPALYKSLVMVNGDSLEGSFIAALDRASGEIVWRTPRTSTGSHGSYATPIVASVAGRDQLLLTGTGKTTSYDPETGKLLWSCDGPAEVTAATVAFSDELVFASGGFPEKEIIAIRADGSGNVTDSHIVWRAGRNTTYVPSPLYHEGRLYVVGDNGVAACFNAETGDTIWQKRLEGNFTASPVLAGGAIYATNEAGRTFVFRAADEFEMVAENDLQQRTLASPAIAGGAIYLRTESHLYRIGE